MDLYSERTVCLAAGLRTPFVGVDGPFAHRDFVGAFSAGGAGNGATCKRSN